MVREETGQNGQEDRQFQLKHLLLGMGLFALALAPVRFLLPAGEVPVLNDVGRRLIVLAAMLLQNVFVTIPCIWGGVRLRSSVVKLVCFWIAYCGLLTAVELGILISLLGSPGPGETLGFFLMNIAQGAAVFGTLRIFRTLGFRLVRRAARG